MKDHRIAVMVEKEKKAEIENSARKEGRTASNYLVKLHDNHLYSLGYRVALQTQVPADE